MLKSACCVAGSILRPTNVYVFDSTFQANGATNLGRGTLLGGSFDVGECADAHLSSCRCVGMYNTTFEDHTGLGLCLRDVLGGCELARSHDQSSVLTPLFDRKTIASEDDVDGFDSFLGLDFIRNDIAVDVRHCAFRRNVATSQLDASVGAAALDLLSISSSVLADLVFEGNIGRQGSAVHLDSCTATILWNDTFEGNIATHEGGAIAIVNSPGKGILLGASKLYDNVALAGGALYGGPGVPQHTKFYGGTRLHLGLRP